MNEAKEILDALPKSREYYTTVRSAELARLREIAGCFDAGDAERMERAVERLRIEAIGWREEDYLAAREDIAAYRRLQKAAKLEEEMRDER